MAQADPRFDRPRGRISLCGHSLLVKTVLREHDDVRRASKMMYNNPEYQILHSRVLIVALNACTLQACNFAHFLKRLSRKLEGFMLRVYDFAASRLC